MTSKFAATVFMSYKSLDGPQPTFVTSKDAYVRYLQQMQEDTVTFCLGHTGYNMPKAYLEADTIAHISGQAYVEELTWHASLPDLMPARLHWWDTRIQKLAIGMHFARKQDPNYAVFMQHWQPLFEKSIDKKPHFVYRQLLGYAWGNLLDMVEWVGECTIHDTNKQAISARTIPLYASTAGDDTRLFICDIDNFLVLDFHVQNLEVAHMLTLAARVCELVISWRVV